jgi:YD repeat-containing protein
LTRSEIVNYIHSLGQDATELPLDQILGFAVALAADVGPNPYLAGAVDAVTPAPGILLVFSRLYSASFESRYDVGPLGRGWSHNWEFAVEEPAGGDVILRGPGGADRHFLRQPDDSFQPLPGDFGTLTYVLDTYQLAEQDGTLWQFRTDGLLDYAEDTNGNRVTLGYSGGLLTSLTHSGGSQLLVDYTGDGRVWHVTDPNGAGTTDDRVTTFTYDASAEYLTAVTTPGGRDTTYDYDTAGPVAVLHVLLSAEYADDSSVQFQYDGFGRLTQTSGTGGVSPITYHYDSLGVVRVENAEGVETIMRRGLDGQWSQVASPAAQSTLRVEYNGAGQPTEILGPGGELYRYAYDTGGNVTEVIDPLLGVTAFTYESVYQNLDVVTDAKTHAIDYDHDTDGNLIKITYEDATHEDFTYDALGNLLTWTNRRGQVVTYTYNAAGQLTGKDYDTTPAYVDYQYEHDTFGKLMLSSYTTDAGTFTTTYTYDPATQWLERIDYPGGQWFEYEYDEVDRRTKRTDHLGNVEN